MLPIPKSQTDAIDIEIDVDDADDDIVELRDSDVEMELGEADLVAVDVAPAAPASSMRPRMPSIPPPLPRASLPEIMPVAHPTPRPSRRTLDEKTVEDVTGQCLATIAEVTSRTRIPLSLVDAITAGDAPAFKKRTSPPASASRLATPVMRPRPHEEPEESTEQNPTASVKPMLESTIRKKLPPISAPPFVRRSSASLLPSEREIVPRISPVAPSSAIAMATDTRRPLSDAPVSMSKLSEATQVVVVREPPKAYWVAVAAVIGAAAAIGGMRLTASSPPASPPAATVAVHAAAPQAPVVAPTPIATDPIAKDVVAPPAEKAPSAVVRFGEGQGVAIPAAPPAKSASHAPRAETAKPVVAATTKPASSAPKSAGPASAVPRPPKLPDGSYGLARSDATPASPPAKEPPAPAAPPPPAPEKKAKHLTPEQQLAEAQLKASMK